MFSIANVPSAAAAFAAYTALAAWAMLFRNIIDEIHRAIIKFVPERLRNKLLSSLGSFINGYSSSETLTLVVNNHQGPVFNKLFDAAEYYLPTKISSTIDRLGVSQGPKDTALSLHIEKDQEIIDSFEQIQLRWKSVYADADNKNGGKKERKSFELSFQKGQLNKVLEEYFPCVMERSKAIKEERKVIKLYSLHFQGDNSTGERWGWINLDHPATFDTLAMDPEKKKELMEDLDRFVSRRDYYKRVGKAWKRGYLLYGPPGTGKSSLVAAMANYLNFNIYDLELASVSSNSYLRNLLVGTANRSIIVIEDIDCSVELPSRSSGKSYRGENQLTLSGLLNVIDGLWSSLGDERIIVFTTNHKNRLDPALLRPGRMDMHIHMSYCTYEGFELLASNYLEIKEHELFGEIEVLMKRVCVTPAEVAEELMKNDDADIALKGLVQFLKNNLKKQQNHRVRSDEVTADDGANASCSCSSSSVEEVESGKESTDENDGEMDYDVDENKKKGNLVRKEKKVREEIERLMKDAKISPVKLVEGLMEKKSGGDTEVAAKEIIDFLEKNKAERSDQSHVHQVQRRAMRGPTASRMIPLFGAASAPPVSSVAFVNRNYN